ncbi:post-transcriptional regulator [Alicyclobacillus kakegawensis]|uniref:post-transcriptional regulator n=1 Tax=Alicyclobacillus kakegawensis TaxID=392012 RepID=UPI0009F99242|nr:post-transcriptional regulator [Alicyclobacillus kakegawensis]
MGWQEESGRDEGALAEPWRGYERDLMNLCAIKAEEFHLLGYEHVTAEDVWRCVRERTHGSQPLHRMVEAILGLQIGQFMSYATLDAYRGGADEEDRLAAFPWFDGGKRG